MSTSHDKLASPSSNHGPQRSSTVSSTASDIDCASGLVSTTLNSFIPILKNLPGLYLDDENLYVSLSCVKVPRKATPLILSASIFMDPSRKMIGHIFVTVLKQSPNLSLRMLGRTVQMNAFLLLPISVLLYPKSLGSRSFPIFLISPSLTPTRLSPILSF